ncbi:putative transcriptional regulator [Escherichia coli]|uniref:Putative transcriptional regulator n=1 Tax=Escherichia coli TaxID=562 RepID=A0A376MU17_ECOLX|nr:putative transcriptional regulator [Escherichia coli]
MDLMPDRMGFFAHENSVISELEADHKMDKNLKIADIAARTGAIAEYGFAGAGWQSEYQCTRSRTGAGLRA